MSAVPKQNILPFPEPEKGEPSFDRHLETVMSPHLSGKHKHSEDEQRTMWSRIWRAFKSEELCKGWMYWREEFSLEIWCLAFEQVRILRQDSMKHIRYVKRVADGIMSNGTPQEIADREAAEVEKAIKARNPKYVTVDPESPDVKAFEKRTKEAPQSNAENNPLVLKYQQMIRGKK